MPVRHGHGSPVPRVPVPAVVPSAAQAINIQIVFSIDHYRIINKAPGPVPDFYTPSNYRMIFDQSAKTEAIVVKSAAAARL